MIRHSRALACCCALTLAAVTLPGCSQPEPIDGFWGYAWGTTADSILADSSGIAFRFGGDRFRLTRDSLHFRFDNVQYGLGYDRVELDFTEQGQLWHGRVRVPLRAEGTADSVLADVRSKFGREDAEHVFSGRQGRVSYWQTRDWLDREFTAQEYAPRLPSERMRALDLEVGGCIEECPLFSARLTASGEAYLWAIRGHETEGGFVGVFPDSLYRALASTICSAPVLALADYYGYRGVNLKTRGFRADLGSIERSSVSIEGSGPPVLEGLLDEIDEALADIGWRQIVAWDTVRLSDQHTIDLDSLEQLSRAASR